MVRNTQGGSKTKSKARKNMTGDSSAAPVRYPDDELEFIAYVNKCFGDCRFEVILSNGEKTICVIRGKHKGRNRRDNCVVVGALVLVGLREWENPKTSSDLICIYSTFDIDIIRRNPALNLSLLPNDDSSANLDSLFSSSSIPSIPSSFHSIPSIPEHEPEPEHEHEHDNINIDDI